MAEIQMVIFKLGNEEYGIDIKKVKEIIPYKQPLKIPNTPDYSEGIINIRGEIISIINLKKMFGINNKSINENTRIIITKISGKTAGFIVDDASEVLTIDENNIENTSELLIGSGKRSISGIGKVKDRIILLLDTDGIIDS
ncbi:MAG: chemotaxis protein CheW [Caulobacteraceae bacterium]